MASCRATSRCSRFEVARSRWNSPLVASRSPVIVPPELQEDWLDPWLVYKAWIRSLLDAIPIPPWSRAGGEKVGTAAVQVKA
jgi:hypothetical protein